jgi:hypothetical protein
MIFAGALLICGLAFAQSQQQTPPVTPDTGVAGSAASSQATNHQGTGTISKIDPEKRTITLREFTLTNAAQTPEPGDTAAGQPAPQAETKEFTYDMHTNFASTNPESVDGRMSDLKVGDTVSIQYNDQNTIVRIEEVAAPPTSGQ